MFKSTSRVEITKKNWETNSVISYKPRISFRYQHVKCKIWANFVWVTPITSRGVTKYKKAISNHAQATQFHTFFYRIK